MLRRSLAQSDDHFWWPAECENMTNPDLENPKHLQNHGNLPLNAASMYGKDSIYI